MANKKKIKRHLNIKGLILVLLVLYIIGMLLYTFFSMPIKNIYIKGTKLLSDNEIIETSGIKNYPAIFKISSKKLESKIKELELVRDVKVTKKLNGKLIIEVTEEIPLFYNRITNKVVLSSGSEVENSENYLGIPALINSTTGDILKRFIEAFGEVDSDIIKMINEIEYDPDISEDITIDADRFLLRMNDGNLVYVNILNMKRLNDYKTIYAALTEKGTLLLDSYKTSDIYGLFTAFENDEDSKGDSKDDGGED